MLFISRIPIVFGGIKGHVRSFEVIRSQSVKHDSSRSATEHEDAPHYLQELGEFYCK